MRFKKNERVEFKHNEKEGKGIIIDVIVKKVPKEDGSINCDIIYLVKPDGCEDFDEYLVCRRKELWRERLEQKEKPADSFFTRIKEVDLGDGFKMLMCAHVEDGPLVISHYDAAHGYSSYAMVDEIKKQLFIAYAICSKDDNWNVKTGLKICKHRIKTNPYIKLYAEREREFDIDTIDAILEVKAEYIKTHRERFINKRGEHFAFGEK